MNPKKVVSLIKTLTTVVLIGTLAFGLTSCKSGSSSESVISAVSKTPVGTGGQLISIQSDNVRAAGYDDFSLVMTVQFDNGAIYEYYGVSPDLWTSFIAAQPHPWSQVGYPQLVQGVIPYKRIA
jgi:hypothetical protein